MKYVIFSDAHGNKPYFDSVIKKIDSIAPDKLIYLGDAYGYFHDGNYVIDELAKRDAVILKGNHEAMLLDELALDEEKDALYGLSGERKWLTDYRRRYLKELPSEYSIVVGTKRFLFVHGSAINPINGYLYENDESYGWDEPYDFVFMGHTHRPFIKVMNGTKFVNVGSCGLPRDYGNEPVFCVFDDLVLDINVNRLKIDDNILAEDYYKNVDERIMNVLRRRR